MVSGLFHEHFDRVGMMAKRPANDDRQLLLQMIEEAYRLPNWNETNLRKSLSRVDAVTAAWRPPGARRSIADIVVHCAYWKYALRRRLTGGKRGSFPLRGSNWFKTGPGMTREKWLDYRALLEREHEQLCEAIGSLKKSLNHKRPVLDGSWTTVQRVFWLAIHDGYHTGQINLLKAMYRRTRSK